MPKLTKLAIKKTQQSIRHWIRLRDGKNKSNEGITTESCPLCKTYYTRENPYHDNPFGPNYSCYGCPISAATGDGDCRGSPWDDAAMAACSIPGSHNWDFSTPKFKKGAQKMINFMNKLLPKEHQIKG